MRAISIKRKRQLESIGCKTFACPSLSLIDEKGRELGLKNETIVKAKNMAVEYLKETYHNPRYSFFPRLLASFVYIAAILEEDPKNEESRFFRYNIMNTFCVSHSTFNKYIKDIIETLEIDIINTGSSLILK
jgi:hypothetical protein